VALRGKRPSEYHLFDSWEPMTRDLLTAGESAWLVATLRAPSIGPYGTCRSSSKL